MTPYILFSTHCYTCYNNAPCQQCILSILPRDLAVENMSADSCLDLSIYIYMYIMYIYIYISHDVIQLMVSNGCLFLWPKTLVRSDRRFSELRRVAALKAQASEPELVRGLQWFCRGTPKSLCQCCWALQTS